MLSYCYSYFISRFASYEIEILSGSNIRKVHKRAREWFKLWDKVHRSLSAKPGIAIPIPPTKTVFSDTSESFLIKRKEMLACFLDDLLTQYNIGEISVRAEIESWLEIRR